MATVRVQPNHDMDLVQVHIMVGYAGAHPGDWSQGASPVAKNHRHGDNHAMLVRTPAIGVTGRARRFCRDPRPPPPFRWRPATRATPPTPSGPRGPPLGGLARGKGGGGAFQGPAAPLGPCERAARRCQPLAPRPHTLRAIGPVRLRLAPPLPSPGSPGIHLCEVRSPDPAGPSCRSPPSRGGGGGGGQAGGARGHPGRRGGACGTMKRYFLYINNIYVVYIFLFYKRDSGGNREAVGALVDVCC